MADPRKELLRQIAELRRSIDPKVLEQARAAAEHRVPGGAKPRAAAARSDTVPYDRDSAMAAVQSFLAARKDGGRFKQKLGTMMAKAGMSPTLIEPQPPAAPARQLSNLKPNPTGAKPPKRKGWWPF